MSALSDRLRKEARRHHIHDQRIEWEAADELDKMLAVCEDAREKVLAMQELSYPHQWSAEDIRLVNAVHDFVAGK